MLGSPGWCAGKLSHSGRSGRRTSSRWIWDGQYCIGHRNERLHRWSGFAWISRRYRIPSATGQSAGSCGGRRRVSVRARWPSAIGWSRRRWTTVDGRCWVMRMLLLLLLLLLLLRRLLLGRPVIVTRWQWAGRRVWGHHERMAGWKLMRPTRWTVSSQWRCSYSAAISTGCRRDSGKYWKYPKLMLRSFSQLQNTQNNPENWEGRGRGLNWKVLVPSIHCVLPFVEKLRKPVGCWESRGDHQVYPTN
jgi:hypothetical protein